MEEYQLQSLYVQICGNQCPYIHFKKQKKKKMTVKRNTLRMNDLNCKKIIQIGQMGNILQKRVYYIQYADTHNFCSKYTIYKYIKNFGKYARKCIQYTFRIYFKKLLIIVFNSKFKY